MILGQYSRVLDLFFTWFEVLPNTIKRSSHLRNLSMDNYIDIKVLPSSICKLYNLQMLSLVGLEKFEKLARVYLEVEQSETFVCYLTAEDFSKKGIGYLTSFTREGDRILDILY